MYSAFLEIGRVVLRNSSSRWVWLVAACSLTVFGSAGCKRNRAGAGNGDPRDDAFASYINDAARAVLASVRGQPHEPRWDGLDPTRDLRATDATAIATMAMAGPTPELLAVAVEIEGIAPQQGRIRTGVMVFPDGRVRWHRFTVRPGTTYSEPSDLGALSGQAPALAPMAARTIDTMRSSCSLPTVTLADVPWAPPSAQGEILQGGVQLAVACAQLRAMPFTFFPRVDDMTLIVRGNNNIYQIRSGFEVRLGRVYLRNARARLMRDREDPQTGIGSALPTVPPTMPGYPPVPSPYPPTYPPAVPPAYPPTAPTYPSMPPGYPSAGPSMVVGPAGTTFRWSDGDWVVRVFVTLTNTSAMPATVLRGEIRATANGLPMTPWSPVSNLPPVVVLQPGQSTNGFVGWYYSGSNAQPMSVSVSLGASSAVRPVMMGTNTFQ